MRLTFVGPPAFPQLDSLRGIDDVEVQAHDEPEALRRAVEDADILLVAPRSASQLRELLPHARKVRWIHTLGAGVEALPFDVLRETDVVVTNSAGVFADALGEFAVAAMLWFAKDLRRLVRNQEARHWEPFTVERLEGKRVGIVGYGGIGKAVGRRAAALGIEVFALRRSGASDDPIVTRSFLSEQLDELLRESDFVVLSTPLTPATRGMIDAVRIAQMKPDAVLINISRGAVVDEEALIEALRERRIRGAALDVFETEPLPQESPLWTLENVLLSPHSADHGIGSHERAMGFFLANLERFRRGERLKNIVDKVESY